MASSSAGAAESRRCAALRAAFAGSLRKFHALLNGPLHAAEYRRAFRETGSKYPAFAARVAGDEGGREGLLGLVLDAEFPTLNREAPDALRALVEELFDKVAATSTVRRTRRRRRRGRAGRRARWTTGAARGGRGVWQCQRRHSSLAPLAHAPARRPPSSPAPRSHNRLPPLPRAQAEFELVLGEYGLPAKLAALDTLEDEARRAAADAAAEGGGGGGGRPLALLPVSPEDELRGPAMEVKLAYARALERELEAARRGVAERDAEVAALDARAKRALAAVEARAALFARLAAQAEAAGLAGDGDDDDGDVGVA